jgi:uncharacterized protein YndB with AHSA1/START domain
MAQPNITGDIKLFLQRTIPAPVDRVFNAWTDPESIKGWFAPLDTETPFAEVDLRVGGIYRIGFKEKRVDVIRVISGIYREIHPPHHLVFTWCWEDDHDKRETVVTVELREQSGHTELRLTHVHFLSEDIKNHHTSGWIGCLDSLINSLQTK